MKQLKFAANLDVLRKSLKIKIQMRIKRWKL